WLVCGWRRATVPLQWSNELGLLRVAFYPPESGNGIFPEELFCRRPPHGHRVRSQDVESFFVFSRIHDVVLAEDVPDEVERRLIDSGVEVRLRVRPRKPGNLGEHAPLPQFSQVVCIALENVRF